VAFRGTSWFGCDQNYVVDQKGLIQQLFNDSHSTTLSRVGSRVTFSHMPILSCLMMTDKVTKSDVAGPIFLNAVFLTGINCEKSMAGQYFTMLLFMFILEWQLLKLKHS